MVEVSILIIIIGATCGFLFVISDTFNKWSCTARVPMGEVYDKTEVPLIRLKVEGEFVYFLLDTGANGNHLEESFYNTLINAKDTGQTINTSGGANVSFEGLITEIDLSYGKYKFAAEKFIVANTGLTGLWPGVNVVGIIGSNFFRKHRWGFDFDKRVIHVKSRQLV